MGLDQKKTNILLTQINHEQDIDKNYFYGWDPCESKYQRLIKIVGLNHLKYLKAFIEPSNDMKDVYNSIQEYNLGKEQNVLIVFHDMMVNMISN